MTKSPVTKLALAGIGKIARDQHLPAIAGNPDFNLSASISRNARIKGIEGFETLDDLLQTRPDISAISLCTPPHVRFEMAWQTLSAGKHLLLEKPPGATLGEVQALHDLAHEKGLTMYTSWHARHGAAVDSARKWLANRRVHSLRIIWKEDVRRWHPGQDWIWQAGNLGVFDPGINALSILTHIMPQPLHLIRADLDFPANCQTPIAARLQFLDPFGIDATAEFDWLHTGEQVWDINLETDAGSLLLSKGGNEMQVDGKLIKAGEDHEYPIIYQRFAELIAANKSDVDLAPMRHVADAFLLGKRHLVGPFYDA